MLDPGGQGDQDREPDGLRGAEIVPFSTSNDPGAPVPGRRRPRSVPNWAFRALVTMRCSEVSSMTNPPTPTTPSP